MGLIETQARIGASYLGIADGAIVQRSKEPREGFEPYTKKDGTTGYMKKSDAVDGYLVKVERVESDFGPKWEFTLFDNEQRFVISLGYSNGYAKGMLNSLCNELFDPSEKVVFRPYSFIQKETGKQKQGVTVIQGATKIPWKYGLDDMPRMEQVTVKGQKVWDDSKQLEFLEQAVNRELGPKLLPF